MGLFLVYTRIVLPTTTTTKSEDAPFGRPAFCHHPVLRLFTLTMPKERKVFVRSPLVLRSVEQRPRPFH